MFSFELTCRKCGWRTVCGRDDAVARLRLIGLLRRDKEPADDLVATLLVDAAPRMTCPICKEKKLHARPHEVDDSDAADWPDVALCEICRQPIPPERLEAIPNAKRCAACAAKAESGALPEVEPDYCPRCGAPIDVRPTRAGGITRYKRVCTGNPPCRL